VLTLLLPDEGRGRELPENPAAAEGERLVGDEPNLSGKRTGDRRASWRVRSARVDADGVILSGLGQGETYKRSPDKGV
jgi:hypothetical protein